jgi:hypothetical protein
MTSFNESKKPLSPGSKRSATRWRPEGNHKGCPYMGRGAMDRAIVGAGPISGGVGREPTVSAFEWPTEFRDPYGDR